MKLQLIFIYLTYIHYCICYNDLALILPKSYAHWRTDKKYDNTRDIRRNLIKTKSVIPESHHAIYKVNNINYPQCFKTRDIALGEIICVQCEGFTKTKQTNSIKCKGEGEFMKKSSFHNAINSSCYGKWIKLTERLHGNCSTSLPSFIFV